MADDYCASHTIILRKKRIFRTISDLFTNAEESKKSNYIIVVSKVGGDR